MAEQQPKTPTLADVFAESLAVVGGGVKKLVDIGIPPPQAAEIACRLHQDAGYRTQPGSAPMGMPPSRLSKAEEKRMMLDAIKHEAPRLGITRDDLAGLFDEEHRHEAGNESEGHDPERMPVTATDTHSGGKTHGEKGAKPAAEPKTTQPPKTDK